MRGSHTNVLNATKHSDLLDIWRLTCSFTAGRRTTSVHNATKYSIDPPFYILENNLLTQWGKDSHMFRLQQIIQSSWRLTCWHTVGKRLVRFPNWGTWLGKDAQVFQMQQVVQFNCKFEISYACPQRSEVPQVWPMPPQPQPHVMMHTGEKPHKYIHYDYSSIEVRDLKAHSVGTS